MSATTPLLRRLLALSFLLIVTGCGGGGGDTTTPSVSPTTVALGATGVLKFPARSLAAGTNVSVAEVVPPVLGDDLTAVGSAWSVSVSSEPSMPVEVTLPVPDGEDPADLILVRQEDSGRITLLQTRLDNGMLTARTPGFSTVLVARVRNLLNGFNPWIDGPDFLPVSIRGQYVETTLAQQTGLLREWRIFEGTPGMTARLDFSGNPLDQSNVRLSAEHPGLLTLTTEFTEPATGLNAFAHKTVSVQDTLDAGTTLDINIVGSNTVIPGEPIRLDAMVLNTDVAEMASWFWSFRTRSNDCNENCPAVLTVDNLSPLAEGDHAIFRVTGTSLSGATGSAEMEVRAEASALVFLGFERTGDPGWDPGLIPHPEVELQAQVFRGTPPYTWAWQILPGPKTVTHSGDLITDTYRFTVDQPGDYKARVTITDADNNTAEGFFSFDVGTRLPLQYDLLNVPTEDVIAGEPVAVTLKARGGTLVYGGEQFEGYHYLLGWRNTTVSIRSVVDEGTMSATNPEDGGSVVLSHILSTPGQYELVYVAEPARGETSHLFASPEDALKRATINVVAAPTFTPVVSDFDNSVGDNEGWRIGPKTSGRDFSNCGPAEQKASGGNPDGFISHEELCISTVPNDGWYFVAPGKFYGDMSAAFGHSLDFDLRSNGHLNSLFPFRTDSLIVLHGAGKYVYLPTSGVAAYVKPNGGIWTHYSFPLSTDDPRYTWWVSTSYLLDPAQPAIDADLREVLADLDGLSLFGDFSRDATDIDNVVLGAN